MPVIGMLGPDCCEIGVECVRGCGHDGVAVYLNTSSGEFTPELSCAACDIDAGVAKPFTQDEQAQLVARAKAVYDNYCPSDAELDAAGMLAR